MDRWWTGKNEGAKQRSPKTIDIVSYALKVSGNGVTCVFVVLLGSKKKHLKSLWTGLTVIIHMSTKTIVWLANICSCIKPWLGSKTMYIYVIQATHCQEIADSLVCVTPVLHCQVTTEMLGWQGVYVTCHTLPQDNRGPDVSVTCHVLWQDSKEPVGRVTKTKNSYNNNHNSYKLFL